MKKVIVFTMAVLVTMFVAISCGGSGSSVELSEEMQDFVSMSIEDVQPALNKYGANSDVQFSKIAMYELEGLTVTAKNGDCYSMEFTAGIATVMYDVCWTDGKISKIEKTGKK